MRILVEPSEYPLLQNIGDISMQQTAVSRIAEFWPNAEIQVLTDCPESHTTYAPNVKWLSAAGRHAWMSGFFLPIRRRIYIPQLFNKLERRIRRANQRIAERLTEIRLSASPAACRAAVDSFLDSVGSADLLVVCGMGGITDVFEDYALDLLDTIALVKANRKSVVAMFGQGIGPIGNNSAVAQRARQVLPYVEFIALRESRASLPLLKSLGVDDRRVMLTGDDALPVAAADRAPALGGSVGINVRVASYSRVTAKHLPPLRESLRVFAETHSADLQPLPSSLYVEECDSDFIRVLTGDRDRDETNGTGPARLIKQLHRCRIAVVCSYHAGIFALAQGVPIVGLYNSEYYRDKFLGIKDLFRVGVYPVDLFQSDWTASLREQMCDAWDNAPFLRPKLVAAADQQIELGWRGYNHVRELVEKRLELV